MLATIVFAAVVATTPTPTPTVTPAVEAKPTRVVLRSSTDPNKAGAYSEIYGSKRPKQVTDPGNIQQPGEARATPRPGSLDTSEGDSGASKKGIAGAVKGIGLRIPSDDPSRDNPKLIRMVSARPSEQPAGAPASAPGANVPLTEAQQKVVEQARAELAAIRKEITEKREIYKSAVELACIGNELVDDGEYQETPADSPKKKYRVQDKADSYACSAAMLRSDSFWGALAAREKMAKYALVQAQLPSEVWLAISQEFYFQGSLYNPT